MAVRRGDSSAGGAVIGLVVVGVAFVVALGLAIYFYTQLSTAQQAAADNGTTLTTFVAGGERSSAEVLEVQERATQARRSVVQQMLLDNAALKRLIGNGNATVPQIEAQVANVIGQGADLLSEVRTLSGQLDQQATTTGQLQTRVNSAQQTVDALGTQFSDEQLSRQMANQELSMNLRGLEDRQSRYEDRTTQSVSELQQRLQIAREDAEREIRARDETIRELQGTVASREANIRQLRDIVGGDQPSSPDETRVADGRVIEVNNELGLVYIDLGRSDHLVLGTTFEVFDPSRGVLVDETGNLRGKASIEVVDIAAGSAACRVTRSTFGRPIVANDVIANNVYDKDRVFKFYVFGNFDLDGDGVYSVSDADLIASLIQEWGGEVVDVQDREARLTEAFGAQATEQNVLPLDTDYVVIGAEPDAPPPLPDSVRDPIAIQRNAEASRLWQRYNQVTQEAKALGIPILNQNRFLALVGQRTP